MAPYLVIEFSISPLYPIRDILLAVLDVEGYDSFEETENGLKAYILEDDFDEEALKALPLMQSSEYSISYKVEKLESKNWNEEWETNYEPIYIDEQIYIRAPFHPEKSEYPIQIEIMPKMSFGTGHHQTTRLMSRLILEMDLKQRSALDMGTGTGILAILAEKRGAAEVDAIDNFDWAVENTAENAERNRCHKINAILGDAAALENRQYDVIIANINRNVLLEDMKTYIATLSSGGQLALSGFFDEDFDLINNMAISLGMNFIKKLQEGKWLACLYNKA